MYRSCIALFALIATANAFLAPTFKTTRSIAQPVALNAVLTAAELEAVISKGRLCENGECSLEDTDDLISELKDQQHNLHERINEMNNMIKSLEILNNKDDRDTDEVRETVRAVFRLFDMGAKSSSKTQPMGYAGEVGSGPTDAYKALNPKPWKASP